MPRKNEKAREKPTRRETPVPKPEQAREPAEVEPSRAARVRSSSRGGRGR